MKESELFKNLDIFFSRFKDNAAVRGIKKQFLSALKGINDLMDICAGLGPLKAVYEASLRLIEREAADAGFAEDLLALQRGLYVELEHVISLAGGPRHHFIIVIPVADRPAMLKNCLDSLTEQCRIFQYGGFSVDTQERPVYDKISAVIIDDSKDDGSIQKIKELCSATTAGGIRTYYAGLDEQAGLIGQLSSEVRDSLHGLLGDMLNPVSPHKGASVSRNIAYLYLHAFLGVFSEKALIYFLDSDEEFRVKVKRGAGMDDIPFINYFYWFDKIFTASGAEVVTGKVVGDPPVSSSVMINTFLEDIAFFLETTSCASPDEKCVFHDEHAAGIAPAEYHDMVKLFGYKNPPHPRKYHCGLAGDHTVRDCFNDFSKKTSGFFYGSHPTRTQLYVHADDFTKTEAARTVYTGNYVFKASGLRHFIPFAGLKLRMAGPVLGRLLRKKLNQGFVSVNLPLLHKRTGRSAHMNEYRSGISADRHSVDLSREFNRQFWGDVMLFSIERLNELGYPDNRVELSIITETVYEIQEKLWGLYRDRQTEMALKTAKIRDFLSQKRSWLHKDAEIESSLENIALFCSLAEDNFGMNSTGMNRIAGQIKEGQYINFIINAIHFFHETDTAWNELLKSDLALPANCAETYAGR